MSAPAEQADGARKAIPGALATQWSAVEAAGHEVAAVQARLETADTGLTAGEAARRLAEVGPNAVRSHGAKWASVLARQLRSPLLLLLGASAVASLFLGETTDATIIIVILAVSIGLGFVRVSGCWHRSSGWSCSARPCRTRRSRTTWASFPCRVPSWP